MFTNLILYSLKDFIKKHRTKIKSFRKFFEELQEAYTLSLLLREILRGTNQVKSRCNDLRNFNSPCHTLRRQNFIVSKTNFSFYI